MCNNMLVYETQNVKLNDGMISTIMAAIDGETKKKDEDNLQVKTLMHFHQRFGHLAYDTIEKMAREPNSGIWLSDNQQLACVMCAKSKQTKNAQSKKHRRALTNWSYWWHNLFGPEITNNDEEMYGKSISRRICGSQK